MLKVVLFFWSSHLHNLGVSVFPVWHPLFYFIFSELDVLENNKDLKNVLSEFQMPRMKYGSLKVAGFGETKYEYANISHLTG